MEIIRDGPVPVYRQIAGDLRRRIAAGEWQPDRDPLPSRKSISQETGAALTTVDRAMQLLRDEGLVYTVRAIGTFVRRTDAT